MSRVGDSTHGIEASQDHDDKEKREERREKREERREMGEDRREKEEGIEWMTRLMGSRPRKTTTTRRARSHLAVSS